MVSRITKMMISAERKLHYSQPMMNCQVLDIYSVSLSALEMIVAAWVSAVTRLSAAALIRQQEAITVISN